jgi:hypothetical protein
VLVALLAAATPGRAQEGAYSVAIQIDPREGPPTDARPFQLVIDIAGTTAPGRVRPPVFPSIDGLSLFAGPHTSSSLFWSNGRSQASYKIVYQVLAERTGKFEIPALEVMLDGQAYRTEPLRFDVLRGNDPSRSVTPGGSTGAPRSAPDPLFLEVKLGADEVFVGQAVPLTLTLYAAVRWGNGSYIRTPQLDGFWVEEIAVDPATSRFDTRIDNRPYSGYPLRRQVLVPLRAGKLQIDPFVVEVQARQPSSGDVFDIFSFGRMQTVVRKTPPLALDVKPLPPGEPAGFGGAVGRFSVSVSMDRDRAAVNDAVALRATVEGQGSLHAVEPPVLELPAGVKIFDPKVSDAGPGAAEARSRKTWEWVLVPLDPGELTLPTVRFPYFDPERGQYEVAESQPLHLLVERGERSSDPTSIQSEIQMQRRDLAYIKPLREGTLSVRSVPVHASTTFRVLGLLPLVATPLAIWIGRRQNRVARDLGASRARRAGSRARRQFQSARKRMEQLDSAAFHEELGRALVGYVADRFNRAAAGLTYEAADELLASRRIDSDLRRRYRACLERCDYARFVPAAAQAERRSEVLDEAAGLVDELERAS